MLKKFIFFIFILNFLQSCGFTPMYSNNKTIKINIENISLSGDRDLNNFIKKSLERYSSKEVSKKYNFNITTNYTSNAISKDSAGKAINYQFIIEANFLVSSENFKKDYSFKETFIMENFTDQLTRENYEKSNKNNLANIIINKLVMQLSRLE